MDVNENAPEAAPERLNREAMGYVRAGLAYLDRYGGPRARVERTLERRARRKGLEGDAARAMVARAMAKLDALEIMDDRAFAAGKAAALRRRGASRRGAMAKLLATGIDRDLAAEALDALAEGEDDPERTAAERYAERRRLGPWRIDAGARAERRDRDIAAMARAGFPVRLAIAVIDGGGVEDGPSGE